MKHYSNYSENKLSKPIYDPIVEEKKILEFWTKHKCIQKIEENRLKENDGTFTFLNGPPFPTGSPHSGHIVNYLIKDILTRYGRQKNYHVVGKFGWDCHGLPVEHEVDKKLEIMAPQDLYCIGVAKYNEECRKFLQRHETEWKNNLDQLGIWVDFKCAYSTMSQEYMEGVWRVFKQLYDKGLVYKEAKVLPYSIGCYTHLSHFEAELNRKTTNEVAAIFSLQLIDSDVKILIWTDSPWKLGDNFAVCVNPNSRYVKIKIHVDDQKYFLAKDRLSFVFRNTGDYSILEEILGKHLQNHKYHPLFDYIASCSKILLDESISFELGTGIAAMCPHFDQNDYRICLENGLFPDKVICPIDSKGQYTRSIRELAGLGIEEASIFIVQDLQRRGQLLHLQNVERTKLHCWRSDVPLIDRVASTWFLKLANLEEKLKKNNTQVTWIPKSNKFKNDNHYNQLNDWPIGRNRLWGTPIPIWSSPTGEEIRCIGSVQELHDLTAANSVLDLHAEFIDRLVIPSKFSGQPPLRRVPEVFDCWFESGVWPFLQQKSSQADFIVEGQDQMNGWFLTTSYISAALSLPPPAKTVIAHGLVQGPDKIKLSKRKHNNNDATRMAEKYGADALRIYLTTTPLMKGESYVLLESEVRKITENVMQPLYKIVYDTLPHFEKEGCVSYGIIIEPTYFYNIFEQWILSRTESLVQFYDNELKEYRFHLVIPRLIELLKQVHEWFIPVMKISSKDMDKITFILFNIMFKACLVLAPFAPFFTEHIYQIFNPWVDLYKKDFIHDVKLTEKSYQLIQPLVELKIARWQDVVKMIREARKKHLIPIEYRISELIVVHPLENYLEDTEVLNETLMKIVNVHQVTRTTDRHQFGAYLKAELKKDSIMHTTMNQIELEQITLAIQSLTDSEVEKLIRVGSQNILEKDVSTNDVEKLYIFEKEVEDNCTIISRNDVFVVIKMNKNLRYYEEGTRMEIISAVHKLRKKGHVFPSEHVTVCYLTKDTCIEGAFEKYSEELRKTTNSKMKSINDMCDANEEEIFQENVNIKGTPVILYLFKEKQRV